MDTLTSLQVFGQIVRLGSFSKAADEMNISPAMASKHIAHLEHYVGAKLLQRNSRNISLTELGNSYHKQALLALELLDQAKAVATSGTTEVVGTLRVSTPTWFANGKIAEWLFDYQRQFPNISLDISATNRKIDLIAEGFDLALRVSPDPKSTLIARKLTNIDFCLVASPDYLKKHPAPNYLCDLEKHQIVYSNYTRQPNIAFYHKIEQQYHQFKLTPHIQSDDTIMSYHLAKAGFGIAYLPYWLIDNDLKNNQLTVLLPNYERHTAELYAVYTDRAFLSAKVRTFIDFLFEKMQNGDC